MFVILKGGENLTFKGAKYETFGLGGRKLNKGTKNKGSGNYEADEN